MGKKIAYCLPSLYIAGGIERVITLKVNYLAAKGYKVYIILTDGKEKKIWFGLAPEIKIIHLDINFDELWNLSLFRKTLLYLSKQRIFKKRLKQTLCHLQPDITISTLRREINFINSIRDGSRKIGEIHVNRKNYRSFNEEHVSLVKKLLQQMWMKQMIHKVRQLDRFVVLCEEDKSQYPELDNVTVISNPLSFFPSQASDCNSNKIIAVGRYEPQKGFDLLLQAWAIIHKDHPEYILNIYGAGDSTPYKKLAAELNLGDSCQINGPTEHIIEKYLESSIFVLSSRYEGFGQVLTEAMACGVPPVAFSCPCGPRDIIKDKEDGFLVENGNIEKLAEKITCLITHKELRIQMGKQARLNARRFLIENIGKQWEKLFEEL